MPFHFECLRYIISYSSAEQTFFLDTKRDQQTVLPLENDSFLFFMLYRRVCRCRIVSVFVAVLDRCRSEI